MGTLDGRIAVVTGASRGIGVGIARRFAAEGATVVVVARTLEAHDKLPGSLRETVAIIERDGGRAHALTADLTDPESRRGLIERCAQAAGAAPHILVNNAAAAIYLPLARYPARRFNLSIELNLHAPLDLAQQCLPAMIERREGWILNISSATARHPSRPYLPWDVAGGSGIYGASKAALNRMSAAMAAELLEHNIAVNTLSPVSAVITPGVEMLGIDQSDPNFRTEPVEAMAEAALLLCSERADVRTGETAYSLELLRRIGRVVRNLDGRGEVSIG